MASPAVARAPHFYCIDSCYFATVCDFRRLNTLLWFCPVFGAAYAYVGLVQLLPETLVAARHM